MQALQLPALFVFIRIELTSYLQLKTNLSHFTAHYDADYTLIQLKLQHLQYENETQFISNYITR